MAKVRVQLHPSMKIDGLPRIFEKRFENISIIESIIQLLRDHPRVFDLCIEKNQPKPGLLFFSNKTELSSLGLLDSKLDEDIEIRVVPILHGG